MEHKCLNCGTEMNVYNQIKSDMIDNPYVGQILFECPNCRHYRRSAFPILSIFEARDALEAGTPILECDNFDDFLKKLEKMAWNSHVENWNELEDNKWKMFCDGGRTVIRFPKTVLLDLQEAENKRKTIHADPGHDCFNCKYTDNGVCEESCSSCNIRLGNDKWEPGDEKDGDE